MHGLTQALAGLMGGLAIFLYGMHTMSGALRRAAGERMRRTLAAAAGTPLRGALAGAAATAVLQSSSAVTVMAVSFTDAGLMDLPQAVAVIFGANVGTTATAQLIALGLEDCLGPLLLAGLLAYLLGRRGPVRRGGLILFSFALLMEGVRLMGGALAPLAADACFTARLAELDRRPVLGMVMGAAVTAAMQSSSAAVALLQSLLAQPGPAGTAALSLAGAVPLLLGSNIGTTATALLAAAGRSPNARRAALAHLLFNLSGALVLLPLTGPFVRLVQLLSPAGTAARQLADAHTLFNLLCTAAWLPLTPAMVRLVRRAVPDKKELVPSKEGASRRHD